jgi:hypothetical protein
MKQIWAAIFPTEGREAAIVIDRKRIVLHKNTKRKELHEMFIDFD